MPNFMQFAAKPRRRLSNRRDIAEPIVQTAHDIQSRLQRLNQCRHPELRNGAADGSHPDEKRASTGSERLRRSKIRNPDVHRATWQGPLPDARLRYPVAQAERGLGIRDILDVR